MDDLSSKSSEPEQQRSLRLLKRLKGRCVQLMPSMAKKSFLLVFAGERTIKCPVGMVEHWLSAGYVKISSSKDVDGGQSITLTQDGVAYLRRSESGDFASQHRQVVSQTIDVAGIKQSALRNLKESPLAALMYSKKNKTCWLDIDQFNAGERLRSDFEFSQIAPNISASWDPAAGLGSGSTSKDFGDNLTDRVLGARQRFSRAMDAVGPELSGILLDVCCFLKGMEQIERERSWPRRSAKLLLKAALSALSRHYNPDYPVTKFSNIRHWAAAGNRPKM